VRRPRNATPSHLVGGWAVEILMPVASSVCSEKSTWPCTLRWTGQHRPHTFGQPGQIRPRHSRGYLPLLPSGPDGVRTRLLRGVQPAPELDTACSAPGPSKGDSTPLKRISGYRAPLAPRLARPRGFFGTHKNYTNISTVFVILFSSLYPVAVPWVKRKQQIIGGGHEYCG